jgi:hypothetical protein
MSAPSFMAMGMKNMLATLCSRPRPTKVVMGMMAAMICGEAHRCANCCMEVCRLCLRASIPAACVGRVAVFHLYWRAFSPLVCRHVRGLRRRQACQRACSTHMHGLAGRTTRETASGIHTGMHVARSSLRSCSTSPNSRCTTSSTHQGSVSPVSRVTLVARIRQYLAADGGGGGRLPDGDVDQPVGQDAPQERLQTSRPRHIAALQAYCLYVKCSRSFESFGDSMRSECARKGGILQVHLLWPS